jgi:hypothetical protein
MFVSLAAVAACSTRKEATSAGTLAQDSALVTRVRAFQDTDKQTDKPVAKPSFPDACGTFMIPAASAGDRARARSLAQRAYTAEMLADMKEASSLLRRASALDATDKSAAYHLGRISEALGDRHSAIQAYCRYLALSPSAAERTEVNQRVLALAQTPTQTQVQAQVQAPPRAPTQRVAAAAIPREVPRPKRESTHSTSSAHSTSIVENGAIDAPQQSQPATTPSPAERNVGRVVVDSDDVEVERPLLPAEQRHAESHGTNPMRTTGIGAIAGAIVGGVAGRNAKSAAIGAVAGGILGAVASRVPR